MLSKTDVLHKVHLTEEKETLLIPLFAKALDNRGKDPILHDKAADELVASIDYDFKRLGSLGGSGLMVVRAKQLDLWVNAFLSNNHNAIVLNLGCGLDTRILRINPAASIPWFDLDFPDVIELRKKFFAKRDNYFMIPSSVTSPQWLEEVPKERPAIIVAEGLLEYLTDLEVKTLFARLTDHFQQGQIAFDILNSFAVKSGNSKMRKTTGATLHWAVDDVGEIEELEPKLRKLREEPIVNLSYIQKLPWNYRVLYSRINHIPFFRNMLFRLLLYQF